MPVRKLLNATKRASCCLGLSLVAMIVSVHARAQTGSASSGPNATVSSDQLLPLGVAVSGIVQKIVVADSKHVDAGQVLLQIDCRPLEEEIKLREANLEAAQAAFERTRNGSRVEEIAIGEASVGVAQARAEEAHAALARAEGLSEGISVTRAQVQQIERDARVTAAQLDDAKKRLVLLKVGSRSEDIAEARAKRDAAAADLSRGKAQLDQCSLRAPVPGVVQVVATLGQFVSTAIPIPLIQLKPDEPSP
jgi:multidrug resistance efflux pump